MGATATLGVDHALAGQGTARPAVHVLTDNRLYARRGPLATIIGGPSGRNQTTARTALWFRDRQFLFIYSPLTKE